MTPCWTCLGEVNTALLVAWLARARPHWPALPCESKPQRIHQPPADLVSPVIDEVLPLLGASLTTCSVMLSRMMPGQSHPMHTDRQRSDWLTRVHVVLSSNPDAWMLFEQECARVCFLPGKVYTFDTLRPHSFGNDGTTERTHLIFDVLKGEP